MNKVERITKAVLNSPFGIVLFVLSLAAFYLPYELRILPDVVTYIPYVRYVLGGLLIIAFFFLYASSLTVFRGNWFLLGTMGLIGVLIYSSYINQTDNIADALGYYGIGAVFLVLSIAVFFKVNPKKYLLVAFFVLFAFNMANIYTLYKYWGVGMWYNYGTSRDVFFTLVGNYNGGIEYVLPMAICGSAYAHRYGKWMEILNYLAMIASLIYAFKCDSMNQILVFAGVLVVMLIGDIAMIWKGLAKFLKYLCSSGIPVIIDFFAFFIVVVFNKVQFLEQYGVDTTFHRRRHIWEYSMSWIRQKPIWGSGMETIPTEATKIPGYAHSHSTYLEVAYKTGFLGAGIVVLLIIMTLIVLFRNKHYRTSYILSAMLFLMGLGCIVETYPIPYVLLCLGLIYYAGKNTKPDKESSNAINQKPKKKAQEIPAGLEAVNDIVDDEFKKAAADVSTSVNEYLKPEADFADTQEIIVPHSELTKTEVHMENAESEVGRTIDLSPLIKPELEADLSERNNKPIKRIDDSEL